MHRALGWQANHLIRADAGAKAWPSPAPSERGERNSRREARSQNSYASSWRNNRGSVRESAVYAIATHQKGRQRLHELGTAGLYCTPRDFLCSVSNSVFHPVLNKLLENRTLHLGGAVNPTSTRTLGSIISVSSAT